MAIRLRKFLALILVVYLVTSACALAEQALRGDAEPGAVPTPEVGSGAATEAPPQAVIEPQATAPQPPAALPTSAAPADTPGAEWTVLMYLDADDDILEQDILIDLNEMERVGSTAEVQIVAQIDRYNGAYTGDGDWNTTKRFHVQNDPALDRLASTEIQDLGEVNSGAPAALADFIAWGIQNYPARKYALFMSDHGSGWLGGWSDPAPTPNSDMMLIEIRDGIAQGLAAAGVEQFELLSFDACLMAQFEVLAAVYPYARYGIASAEVIPAIGLAYTGWLDALVADPGMDGRRLAEFVADTYIYQDSRILDDGQRRALFGPGSAEQIAAEVYENVTLSAVEMEAFPGVIAAVDSLTAALAEADQTQVAKVRAYALSYHNVFGEGTSPSFLDLGNFAAVAADEIASPAVASAAQAVQTALRQALVLETHGAGRAGSTGLSIFFPNSDIYEEWLEDYTTTTAEFPKISSWDDFLSFHYYGTPFDPVAGEVAAPPPGAIITAPGAGEITLLPVEISTASVAQDETVTLTSQVSGENIAYVFTFVGYHDPTSNAVLAADMNFMTTDSSREVDGVFYPDFSGGPVDLEWEWTPALFNLNDGQTSGFALFEPEDYGAPNEASTYAVYGIWRKADGSQEDPAMVYFVEGEMQSAYAFPDEGRASSPYQITPEEGDQFTVLYTVYTQDIDQEVLTSYQEGDTFTLGETWFTWEEISAPAGSYVVGFIAMDFDGNLYYQVAPLEVR